MNKIININLKTLGAEFKGFILKKIFNTRDIKKKINKKKILSLKNFLFSSRFIKKLIEIKKINEFMIKFPKIILTGNKDKRTNIPLSLISKLKNMFLRLFTINLVAGDGFEPPTFRL